MSDTFWQTVKGQLTELESAASADDVVRILSKERNPYRHDTIQGDGFFAGGGGDDTVREALRTAGWSTIWSAASYWYAMRAPDGSEITYVEGDIYKGQPAGQVPKG